MSSLADPYTVIFGLCGVITYGTYRLSTRDDPKSTQNAQNDENQSQKAQKGQNATKNDKNDKNAQSLVTAEFVSFQRTWLCVYLLAMFSDWLQGPYAYALYSSIGFSSSDIALLSLIGFASSMLFGTFAGSISDSLGRKRMSLIFALLYSTSALTKLSQSFIILAFGRVLSGIATSLLFSVFESWMVCAHNKRKFPKELISDTFSKATAGNGICAVFAGLLADQMSSRWGFASPFIFACVPLLLLAVIVQLHWDENTGDDLEQNGEGMEQNEQDGTQKDQKDTKSTKNDQNGSKNDQNGPKSDPNSPNTPKSSQMTPKPSKLDEILSIFRSNPHVLALGLAQSLFEGAMYTFVFLWSPTLSSVTQIPDAKLPYGKIFSTFMVIISLGSYLFGYLVKAHDVLIIPFIIHALAAVSMVLAGLLANSNEFVVLALFLAFELACGMFWPTYGTIRSTQIPEAQRATVSSLFRIPLNLFVIVLLGQTEKMSTQTMFNVCAFAHLGSLFFYSIFYFKATQLKEDKLVQQGKKSD